MSDDSASQVETEIQNDSANDRKEESAGIVRERPDVFTYFDYKVFLKDMINYYRLRDSGFSMRRLSREAGLSPGYLPIILNTPQNMAHKTLDKVIPCLKISPAEAQFLRLLRDMAEPASDHEREEILRRLQRSRRFKEENQAEAALVQYLEGWHYIAIKELAHHPDFQLDVKWIQERLQFQMPTSEIERAIEFLVEEGFLKRKAGKGAQVMSRRLQCQGDVYKMALISSHKQFFELATESMTTVSREDRNILGHSMPMDEEGFQRAKAILDRALEEIAHIEPKQHEQIRVVNFSFAAFPLSKEPGK